MKQDDVLKEIIQAHEQQAQRRKQWREDLRWFFISLVVAALLVWAIIYFTL
jgi:hypothetical protein